MKVHAFSNIANGCHLVRRLHLYTPLKTDLITYSIKKYLFLEISFVALDRVFVFYTTF